MSELAGLPEWLGELLVVAAAVLAYFTFAAFIRWRTYRRLLKKRDNPTEREFLSAMQQSGVSPEVAAFLWVNALSYVEPHLAPHPDDLLGNDLMIDEDDWGLDWPREIDRPVFHAEAAE